MRLDELKAELRRREAMNRQDWLNSLPPRKRAELEHHNDQRDSTVKKTLTDKEYEAAHGNKKFYATVELSDRYLEDWLKSKVPGKVFLDYACGNGNQVIRAAKMGAVVAIGIDLSDVSLANARKRAKDEGVSDRCFFIQADCENTELPAESIDVILCSGVLHHLDLSYAYPEMRRILREDGWALAVEALGYNPAIKLYRRLTPHMRTDWEKDHILSMREVKFAKRFFNVGEVKFWHLFAVLAAYARKNKLLFQWSLKLLNEFDKRVLRIPGLQLMAWQFTFEMHKQRASV